MLGDTLDDTPTGHTRQNAASAAAAGRALVAALEALPWHENMGISWLSMWRKHTETIRNHLGMVYENSDLGDGYGWFICCFSHIYGIYPSVIKRGWKIP